MTFQIGPTIKSNNVCEKIESARLEIALQILGQRKQGRTLKQVASEFGVSLGTIGNLVRFAEQKTCIKKPESKYRKRMSDDQKTLAAFPSGKGMLDALCCRESRGFVLHDSTICDRREAAAFGAFGTGR